MDVVASCYVEKRTCRKGWMHKYRMKPNGNWEHLERTDEYDESRFFTIDEELDLLLCTL